MTCIPQEAWLHPELRLHLPALERLSQSLQEGRYEWPELDTEQLQAVLWLSGYAIEGTRAFGLPFLSPEYCDKLVVEANEMRDVFGYHVNESEQEPYQIPELVVQQYCGNLATCLNILFERVMTAVCRVAYGITPAQTTSIQFAKYEPHGVDHGNWHTDIDSDITAVVSLQPEAFTGGGTDIRTRQMHHVTVDPLAKGHALLFHGKTTVHRGRAVKSGTRDLLVFWSEVK